MRKEKNMLQDLIKLANEKVISRLQEGFISKTKLRKRKEYFKEELSKIWGKDEIEEENKFTDEMIYGSPLEVIYLMYCYPEILRKILKDPEKIYDYWEFLMGQYPRLDSKRQMKKFYAYVKSKKK